VNDFFKRTVLFWAIAQGVVVIAYRCFGAIYRTDLQALAIEDGTGRLSQTVGKKVTNFTA